MSVMSIEVTLLAACAEESIDPDWFFDPIFNRDAVKICAGCPIIFECAEYALNERIKDGIWGGMTESERASIIRRKTRITKESLLKKTNKTKGMK